MNREELKKYWLEEENIAHIKGWDFSHIDGKYDEEQDLPWDYKEVIDKYLKSDSTILDIDTGGGEFLLSLDHPYENTSATEAYPPNVALCEETLLPLGIDFKEANGKAILPFEDNRFDMVINRHGDFNPKEICRVLKPGGLFITEQVGAQNDRELVKLLLSRLPELPFPEQYLNITVDKFKKEGMEIIEACEAFRPITFYDVGALVWFARIIEWEFIGFNVQEHLDNLYKAQNILEKEGKIEGSIHRYLVVARK